MSLFIYLAIEFIFVTYKCLFSIKDILIYFKYYYYFFFYKSISGTDKQEVNGLIKLDNGDHKEIIEKCSSEFSFKTIRKPFINVS